MYFVLYPHLFRKGFTQQDGQLTRELSFECEIETDPSSKVFEKSVLQDGRAISSVRCSAHIKLRTEKNERDDIIYLPAFSDDELRIKYPDCLELHIFLNEEGFNAIWSAAEDTLYIIFGGEITHIPPMDNYNLTLEPYVWDISSKDNHTKPVEGFWFSRLIKGCQDTKNFLQHIRDSSHSEQSLSRFIEKQREYIASVHHQFSGMQRIHSKILDIVETKARRRSASVEEAKELLNEARSVVDSIYYGVRPLTDPDETVPDELWLHQNVLKIYEEGRKAAGSWSIDRITLSLTAAKLLKLPWLRVDELHWAIVNALVFSEIVEFGENIKIDHMSLLKYLEYGGNLKKMKKGLNVGRVVGFVTRISIVIFTGIAIWIYLGENSGNTGQSLAILLFGIVFSYWLMGGFASKEKLETTEEKQRRLWLKMRDVYEATTQLP